MIRKLVFLLYCYYTSLFLNAIVFRFSPWFIRKFFLHLSGTSIKRNSKVDLNTYFLEPRRISIGEFSHINQGSILDGRGYISIGSNVSISHRVSLITGSHNVYSQQFEGIFRPIKIEDNVFIGCNATILGGVCLGKGSVICAGAVVTKDVLPYQIVGGIPAKPISTRIENLAYRCSPPSFT